MPIRLESDCDVKLMTLICLFLSFKYENRKKNLFLIFYMKLSRFAWFASFVGVTENMSRESIN